MFRANPQHTGEYRNGGSVLTNTELWRFQTEGDVSSSPAVANGVVFVGSDDGHLYAIDAVTGTEIWRFRTGDLVYSSPAASNGIVYSGSDDDHLYAIDAVSGTEIWRFRTEADVTSSLAASNGVGYFGSDDGDLYAIDAVTGTEIWRFETDGDVSSSPAVANGVVYVGSDDGYLYAIDAVAGTEIWRFRTDGDVYSSPAVANGVVFVGSDDGHLYAIDAVTGTEIWRFRTDGDVSSSPAVSNGVIYIGSNDGCLYAIDGMEGTEVWRLKTGNKVYSSPAVSNGIVYVGSDDGYLYAIGTNEAVLPQEKSRQQQGTEPLFIRLRGKAEKLAWYAPLFTGTLKELEVKNTTGKVDEVTKTLQVVEGTIDTLLEIEASLASWKTKGYDTVGLETLQPENTGEVITAFRQYEQAVQRLETISKELPSKKVSFPQLVEQPETANLIRSIERDLKDPARIEAIEKGYQQLKHAIRQLEDQQKSTELYLREKAEIVERESATITKSTRQQDIPRAMSPESPSTKSVRCQQCGSSFHGEPTFCTNCGARLDPVLVQEQNTRPSSSQLGIPALPYAMFRANPQHTGEYDNSGSVLTNTELWRFGTEGDVSSSPAASNGTIYVGSDDGHLYAIDAVTGTEIWRFKTGDLMYSSPAVANGIVYSGSDDGHLYAIDAVTGTVIWKFKTESDVTSSLALSNGVVYIGSDDGYLYAIDAVTGTGIWRFGTEGDVSSSPAVANGVVYFGSDDGHLYAVDAVTGTVMWRFRTDGDVYSSPAVSNGIIYFGSDDGYLYAIDAVTGTVMWRFRTEGEVSSSPAVSNGVVYIGSNDGCLYAIDGMAGTEIWRFKTGNKVYSSPAVSNGAIYFGSDDGYLYAIDAMAGTEIWRFETGNKVFSSPAVSNGAIYFGSDDGYLYAIGTNEAMLRQVLQHDTEQMLSRLRVKAEKLVRYAPLVTGSFKEAENQNVAGQSDDARKTLQDVESTIDTLLENEASLASWKTKGYDTAGLETLQPENSGEVIATFQQYDQAVHRLETISKELASKKVLFPQLVEQPGTADLVLSIERDLNDPARLDTVEKDYQQLDNTIRQLEDRQKSTEQNLREQAEIVEREAGSPTVKQETAAITKCIRQQDIPRAQELFQGLAERCLSQVNTALGALRAEGAVVDVSSDPIRQQVAEQHYGDAVIGSEKAIAELTRVRELFAKAKVLRPDITGPVIIALYNSGKYEEFIRASEEQQRLNRKITELKINGKKLLDDAERFGQVPERVRSQLDATDIPTIQRAITELETFKTTIKPELNLTLGHTQLIADEWDRLIVQLANHGNAHVNDIRLTFSDEFDTKWIKTATVNAGVTTTLDIAIRPKLKGKVPLEVTALYRDGNDKEYRETHEFWIEVVEKNMTATSGTHTTPAGQFTSGTATQKQLPEDLSDRYTESEFIGKGGFARVFKAKRKDGKYVAVKIPITLDATTGKSFIAEMQNWTRLSHPNIVKLYNFNIMPMAYFEEELCDSALADQKKPIENEEAAWILFNICEGLKFAHGLKIIHRDLKPQNILLKNGVPKISDWGLSKVISESTSTTITSFTPFYAAPEQIKNRAKDERTDIWQLGVILYELITGMLPFRGESMFEIGMNIATKDPQSPGEIQPDAKVIESVVMKCLQKEPEKRYQSVLELQKDLAMYLRNNYAELLSTSVNAQDYTRSASFCGDLVMINMVTGDIATAYKYVLDLVQYTKGNIKIEAQELSDQLKMRMEMGVTEIPAELIQKADLIVHQVNTGYRKRE